MVLNRFLKKIKIGNNLKYQNTQFWSECQLVALWNAYRFHGKEPPKLKSWEYALRSIGAGGVYGSCIHANKELRRLRLRRIQGSWSLRWVRKNLPVSFSLFTKHRGYHEVLCVGVHKDKLLLANYTWGRLYWLHWKNVKKMKNQAKKPDSIQLK